MSEKDVQVSISGDMLTINGEKQQQREKKDENYHLTEGSYGHFQRSFVLPGGWIATRSKRASATAC